MGTHYDASGDINALDAARLIDHDGDPCSRLSGDARGEANR